MKKSVCSVMLLFLLLLLASCHERRAETPHVNSKLKGCWVGGLLVDGKLTGDVELRLISIKPDSTPYISLIYELGPRSRVWEYDTEIECSENELSWLAHRGYLSSNLDTMYLTKNWKGETTRWLFYRDRSYDPFIEKFLSCTPGDYTYTVPEDTGDNLECACLSGSGIDSTRVTDFLRDIKEGKYGDIHGILIYLKGKLVLEDYFALNGKFSGDFVNQTYRNKTHQLSSVTKGILSMATGVAIEKKHITDVDEKVINYLPGYSGLLTGPKSQIEIKHLLTMTSGLEWRQFGIGWDDPRNNAAEMYRCGDVIQYIAERPLVADPGKSFNYTNGEPVLLGAVLSNACKSEVDSFIMTNIFDPLGIKEYEWSRYPDGSLETDGGLKLNPRDLLKTGIVVLNKGSWKGLQIVTEEWITESTTPQLNLSPNRGYGYYWNEMIFSYKGKTDKAIFIPGDGGQFMAIFPSLDMVVVFTAGIYDKDPTRFYWPLINNQILPALDI